MSEPTRTATSAALADAAGKAAVLSEALTYMRRYAGKTILVKYGGHAMGDEAIADRFARDIVLLEQGGIDPIVVHGGRPQSRRGPAPPKVQSAFIRGVRIRRQATVAAVGRALSGF